MYWEAVKVGNVDVATSQTGYDIRSIQPLDMKTLGGIRPQPHL